MATIFRPYRIIYRILDDGIDIVTAWHYRRILPRANQLIIKRKEQQRRYSDYVAGDCSNAELEIIRTAAHRNQLTGAEHFKREIEQKLARRLSHRQPGRPG